MKDIFALTLDESSGEERLPGFSAEFPYLHSRAFLNRYVVPWHWHPALELFYVESGAMAYDVPGGSVRLPAGAGGLVRGGVLHASHPLEENTVQQLHLFDASFLAGASGGIIERRYIAPLTHREDLELLPLFPDNPAHAPILEKLRASCATPLAMGELFNNPMEWQPLVEHRWIDFIRCHVSQIGGVTPARKLAAYCEPFGVRTAWHGPGDVSPIGHMANVHLDLTTTNFGIQEWCGMETDERVQEIFEGCAQIKDGFVWANDRPGWGIEVNLEAAKKYPTDSKQPRWLLARLPDGTSVKA